jgi:hypothetical protein
MPAPDCPSEACEHPGVSHAEMLRLVARPCRCGHRQERHGEGPCDVCVCEAFAPARECA